MPSPNVRNRFGSEHLGRKQTEMLKLMIRNNHCWPPQYHLRYDDKKIMKSLVEKKIVYEVREKEMTVYRIRPGVFANGVVNA